MTTEPVRTWVSSEAAEVWKRVAARRVQTLAVANELMFDTAGLRPGMTCLKSRPAPAISRCRPRSASVRAGRYRVTEGVHVGHILNKLGFHVRTEIATWAIQHDPGGTSGAVR